MIKEKKKNSMFLSKRKRKPQNFLFRLHLLRIFSVQWWGWSEIQRAACKHIFPLNSFWSFFFFWKRRRWSSAEQRRVDEKWHRLDASWRKSAVKWSQASRKKRFLKLNYAMRRVKWVKRSKSVLFHCDCSKRISSV